MLTKSFIAVSVVVAVFTGCDDTKNANILVQNSTTTTLKPPTPSSLRTDTNKSTSINPSPPSSPITPNHPAPPAPHEPQRVPPQPAPPQSGPPTPAETHRVLPAEIAPPGPRSTVEGEFYERLYVEGEGDIPAQVMVQVIPQAEIDSIQSNQVGRWVDDLLNNRDISFDANIVGRLARAIGSMGTVDYKRFWYASKGPAFLDYINVAGVADRQVACGTARGGDQPESLNCFSFMTLVTNIPVPAGMKPRHVAKDLGLDVFCRANEAGLVRELQLNVNDVSRLGIQLYASDEDKRIQSYRNGFGANWLAFCPNLIEASTREIRKMVFDHAMYRNKVRVGRQGGYEIRVDVRNRTTTFAEGMPFLLQSSIEEVMRPVGNVRFFGEAGIGPGVVTNWYEEMGKQIFSTELGIFEHSDNSKYVSLKKHVLRDARRDGTVQVMKDRLRAAGRFFGHAIVNGRYIASDMTYMFIAKLVGKVVGFEALGAYNPQEYNFFRMVHDTAGSDSGIPIPEFLDPSGRLDDEWPESQEERDKMLDWYISNYASALADDEYAELVGGLFDVIPKSVFESGIKVKELHEVLFGAATVDLDDMFANWDISNFGTDNHPQIVMLKAVLRGWESNPDQGQAYLRRFVDFVTGSSRVVAGGFGGYQAPFTVIRLYGERVDGFPVSHNCFNRVDMPTYTSQARMEERLREAIFGANGFGII